MHKVKANSSPLMFYQPEAFQEKEEIFLRAHLHAEIYQEMQLASFSNRNFKIIDAFGDRWVFRIPSAVSRCLCDQKQEKQMLDWANKERISLIEVASYDEQEGYLLTPFLFGSACCAGDFSFGRNLQEALQILHRLHISKEAPVTSEFDFLARYKVTKEVGESLGVHFAREVDDLAQGLQEYLSQIPAGYWQKAPCHNDPSPENFFRQNGHLYLHDWELACINDPMWDLAHLSVIGQVGIEEIFRFYPTLDPLAKEKVTVFQAFIFLNTIVWAALEKEMPHSSLPREEVDMLYRMFLTKAQELIESAPFQIALEKLCKETTL